MDWTAQIDNYCERLGPYFWAEPINAATNAAFLVAAFAAWRAARDRAAFSGAIAVLVFLLAAIGLGSFLFHTVAQRWAALADVLPILLFILAYLAAALNIFFEKPWSVAIPGAFLAFVVAGPLAPAASRVFGEALNGSEGYLPALALLLGVAAALGYKRHPAAQSLAVTAGIFVLSLTARSIDQTVCGSIPIGTHFLWHILNALVLHRLIMALFVTDTDGSAQSGSLRSGQARSGM